MTGIKEHPILFSAPMVRAILAERKTRTRRLSKRWLRVKEGDRLWVREQLILPDGDPWCYAADNQVVMVDREDETAMLVWAHHKDQDYCPSIHMPRWASRITLEATADAREEQLQDITEEEALAEGCGPSAVNLALGASSYSATCNFATLWGSLHTKPDQRWQDNPAVVVLAFRRIG